MDIKRNVKQLKYSLLACAAIFSVTVAQAAEPGISDNEIKIGQTYVMSGPNAGYGQVGAGTQTCFRYLNGKDGGVKMGDGKTRKISFVGVDDGMEPARGLAAARQLVLRDKVFLTVGNAGTSDNMATAPYYNAHKVPTLLIFSGGPDFGNEESLQKYPWTFPGIPSYSTEAKLFANFIKENWPDSKVALLNDDSGGPFFAEEFLRLAKELDINIVAHEEHSYSEPTIDSRIDRLAASGADVFVDASTPKFIIQALKRMPVIDWHPKHMTWQVGGSIAGTLKPAGLDVSKGIYSTLWLKDPNSSHYKDDPKVQEYLAAVKEYGKSMDDPTDTNFVTGWVMCNLTKEILEQTQEPTREGVRQAAMNLSNVTAPMLAEGVSVTTKDLNDKYMYNKLSIGQFDGESYIAVGDIVDLQ